jgi:hypothetical protein
MANRKGRPATNIDGRHISFRMTKQNFDWLKNLCESKKFTMSDVLQECVTTYRSQKPKVEIKDYEKEVHYLLLALQGVGISLDYVTADLINLTLKRLNDKGSEMSLMDNAEIVAEHKKKWETYFKNNKQNDQ